MTKKINKPELAILNDVFVTVASQILNFLIGSLNSDTGDGNENITNLHVWRAKAIALHALHVHALFTFVYISLPSSAKQQREIAKFEVL